MNLKGIDYTKILRKIGIYDELDMSLSSDINVKPRITKEMPRVIVTSTPRRISRSDIIAAPDLELEKYYRSGFYEI